LHYDLHAGNVLRDGDQYSIIDWEGSPRGLVLIDGLDFYRRFAQKKRKRFSKVEEDIFKKFREWSAQHFDLYINEESKDLHFVIYAMERSMILWETRKVDRFQDKNG